MGRSRTAELGAAVVGLVTAAVVGLVPGPAAGAGAPAAPRPGSEQGGGSPPARDLPRLQSELAAVTARAQLLATDLEVAGSRDSGLRRRLEDLLDAQDAARAELGTHVRRAYIRASERPHPWVLPEPGGAVLAERLQAVGARTDAQLVAALSAHSDEARALQERADRSRDRLRREADEVLAAQETARALLAEARRLAAQAPVEPQQVEEAPLEAAPVERGSVEEAPAEEVGDRVDRLAAAERALDEVSASVTRTLTPAETLRGRRSARSQQAALAAVEAAGAALPAGHAPTGQVVRGTASWYGPGFVGRPTASGTPYDPERLTCAHKTLRFGTVLHVRANGRSTNCLVNDRGPYAGDRVLDLSRAASRALGYDGTAQVVAEVLEATG